MAVTVDDDVRAYILNSAPRLEGFSARAIEQLMIDIQTVCDDFDTFELSQEIAEKAISKKIAEQKLEQQMQAMMAAQHANYGFVGQAGGLQMAAPAA